MSGHSRDGRGRVRLLGLTGILIFAVLSARLFWIQIVEGKMHATAADDQHIVRVRIAPTRGEILDRNGNQLAYSVQNPSVVAEPRLFTDPATRRRVAAQLSPLLSVPVDVLEARLNRQSLPTVVLNRKATAVTLGQLQALKIPGIRIEMDPKRVYPRGAAAAHVTGFVNIDQAGTEGTELAYEKALQGTPGWITMLRDAKGGLHPFGEEKPAVPGQNLVLTIDSRLQEATANRLNEAVEKCEAKGGWAIVVDPLTGDILAMANAPSFDPTYYEQSPRENYRNHVVSDGIEPGSTFKAITVSAALEEGVMRPETPIDCMGGHWMLYGKPITDHERFGVLPFIDAFAHSSNIAMAQVGLKLGPDRLYHYLKKFGFGQRTGLGLPGESQGYLKKTEQWSGRTPATIAFGYEIRVTALQLAMAYAALANKGILMKPRLVKEVRSPDGTVVRNEPEEVRRVVTEKTAARLLEFMGRVVTDGTGKEAALEWCAVGGKTGTARKYDDSVKAYVHKHYASFIGVAPLEEPRLLCYVVIDEPKGNIYGGSTAAPAFRQIIDAAWKSPAAPVRPNLPVVAAGRGRTVESKLLRKMRAAFSIPVAEAAAETTAAHLEAQADSARRAAEASPFDGDEASAPAAGTPSAAGIAVARTAPPLLTGPRAPRLVGLSLRQALRRLAEVKIEVSVTGDGAVVVRQFPLPGEPTRPDTSRVILFMGTREELMEIQDAARADRKAHENR